MFKCYGEYFQTFSFLVIFELSTIMNIFRRSQYYQFSGEALTSKALEQVLLIRMLINRLINIPINKTGSTALEVKGLPTKSMVLRTSKKLIFTIADTGCLISDLIAKGQLCPTSSWSIVSTVWLWYKVNVYRDVRGVARVLNMGGGAKDTARA